MIRKKNVHKYQQVLFSIILLLHLLKYCQLVSLKQKWCCPSWGGQQCTTSAHEEKKEEEFRRLGDRLLESFYGTSCFKVQLRWSRGDREKWRCLCFTGRCVIIVQCCECLSSRQTCSSLWSLWCDCWSPTEEETKL